MESQSSSDPCQTSRFLPKKEAMRLVELIALYGSIPSEASPTTENQAHPCSFQGAIRPGGTQWARVLRDASRRPWPQRG